MVIKSAGDISKRKGKDGDNGSGSSSSSIGSGVKICRTIPIFEDKLKQPTTQAIQKQSQKATVASGHLAKVAVQENSSSVTNTVKLEKRDIDKLGTNPNPDNKYSDVTENTKQVERPHSAASKKILASLANRSSGKSSKVIRDLERARGLGHLIGINDLPVNVEYSLRRGRVVRAIASSDKFVSRPEGLFCFDGIMDSLEHDEVVKVIEKVPIDKRSPWSSEGFGGDYQKTYYVSDEQVETITRYGYNWNKRRMKFQTTYNPEKNLHPGEYMLKRNSAKGWPNETLTQRIVRLLNRPGYRLDLLAVQANWMRGTNFPTHRDHARYEGWGDVIVSLSLNSGGHVVLKRTGNSSNDTVWAMHVSATDVYSMRDEVRWDWEHGFVAENSNSRISVIWRFREIDVNLSLEDQPTRLDFNQVHTTASSIET